MKANEILSEITTKTNETLVHFCLKNTSCTYLHNDDTLSKNVNGVIVRKKCVRRKDWSYDWTENVKLEDIDTDIFNLDYTRKIP